MFQHLGKMFQASPGRRELISEIATIHVIHHSVLHMNKNILSTDFYAGISPRLIILFIKLKLLRVPAYFSKMFLKTFWQRN